MDENTNDSNKQPEVVGPDSEKETPETPPTSETEHSSEAPDTNGEGESEESDSEESAPDTHTEPEDNEDNNSNDTAKPSEAPGTSEAPAGSETPTPPASPSTPEPPAPEAAPETPATSETPAPVVTGVAGPSIPADDDSSEQPPKPFTSDQPSKKKVRIVIGVVVVVVLAAILVIVLAMSMSKNKTTPPVTTTSTATTPKTAPVNTWTGKAKTYDWDTAANWSLGVPVKGQTLVFNASTLPATGTLVVFQDNVPNLSISKLTIDGTGVGFDVKGDPLTITDGISEDITQAKSSSSAAQVGLEDPLTFTGNQIIQTAANNDLTLNGGTTPATVTVGTSTLQFAAAKSSDIEVSDSLIGTGEIDMPMSTVTTGNIDFNTESPDFTGKVLVNSGATVGMGNMNTVGTGVSDVDAFGTGAITVASGGYLELNEATSLTYTVPNAITIAGNGGATASKDNGSYTGALSTCITKAQAGCSDGATVTLTGKVTLNGDTEFGAFYGLNSAQVPPSTTATYVVQDLVAGGHTLTAVANSKAVIQQKS